MTAEPVPDADVAKAFAALRAEFEEIRERLEQRMDALEASQ